MTFTQADMKNFRTQLAHIILIKDSTPQDHTEALQQEKDMRRTTGAPRTSNSDKAKTHESSNTPVTILETKQKPKRKRITDKPKTNQATDTTTATTAATDTTTITETVIDTDTDTITATSTATTTETKKRKTIIDTDTASITATITATTTETKKRKPITLKNKMIQTHIKK
jgi:hypothetical protein